MQSSQVTLATRASTQVANRQATPSPAARVLPQVAFNSQAGRQASPWVTVRQASQADSTPSQAESAISQAGTPRLPQQTVLLLSQRAQFPRQATPKLPQWTALSPRQESEVSQAGNPQAAPAVRHSARLRDSQASQNNRAGRQFPGR